MCVNVIAAKRFAYRQKFSWSTMQIVFLLNSDLMNSDEQTLKFFFNANKNRNPKFNFNLLKISFKLVQATVEQSHNVCKKVARRFREILFETRGNTI